MDMIVGYRVVAWLGLAWLDDPAEDAQQRGDRWVAVVTR
jgi:hypothetical protein